MCLLALTTFFNNHGEAEQHLGKWVISHLRLVLLQLVASHPEIGLTGGVWGMARAAAGPYLTFGTFCYCKCQRHAWNEMMVVIKPGKGPPAVLSTIISTAGRGVRASWRSCWGRAKVMPGIGRVRIRPCSTTVDGIWVSWASGVLVRLPVEAMRLVCKIVNLRQLGTVMSCLQLVYSLPQKWH